jgi:hypothetical protein
MDDEGGFFNMFGGDDDESEQIPPQAALPEIPVKIKDDTCPLEVDPKGARVRVKYEDQLYAANIKSYQSDTNTYTIIWASSGVLQYRTKPEDINWDKFEEETVVTQETKVEEDELWLAARRGSLQSVKRFIESGVNLNETGTAQQRTPFYHAVFCGHVPVVEYLIEIGAADTDGTAFITANADVREILIKAGMGGKRRASVRKSFSAKPGQAGESSDEGDNKSELRRASVVRAAGSHVASIASEVSAEHFIALQALEERLIAVEAAMKAEIRRPSIKLSAAPLNPDGTIPSIGPEVVKSPRVTFAEGTKPSIKKYSAPVPVSSITPKRAKAKNPVVRFLVAIIPKRFFGTSRKKQ